MGDAQLLEQYVESQSHQAFGELVARHGGWVYALARRRVADEHMAQDVTQAVFLLLAQRATEVHDGQRLGAWLFKTTQFTANHALRDRARRRQREQSVARVHPDVDLSTDPARRSSAADQNLSVVDQAVAQLGAMDRQLIVSRFYQGKKLETIAGEWGLTAESVRKRISRSLSRLRSRLLDNPQLDLPAVLAPLAAMGQLTLPVSPDQLCKRAVHPSSSSDQVQILVKGVKHMLFKSQLKVASIAVLMVLGLGTAVTAICLQEQTVPPASSGVAASSDDAANSSVSSRMVSSKNVIIVLSADHTKAAGFSQTTGQWTTITGAGFNLDDVVVADDVATVSTAGKVHAFSGITGTWGTLTLTSTARPRPALETERVTIEADGHLYVFSSKLAKWTSPF